MTEMTAIVTGAGQGFGLALTAALAARGDTVIACARDADRLHAATAELPGVHRPARRRHRPGLPRRAGPGRRAAGSTCWCTTPASWARRRCRRWQRLPARRVARGSGDHRARPARAHPARRCRCCARRAGTVITLSSDAAVEAYPGWGGYGAAKAALDQLAAVLAREEPDLRVYAFDPGDMRTAMHQRAFPGEDISDRPLPETVVPGAAAAARRAPAERPLPRRRPAVASAARERREGGHRLHRRPRAVGGRAAGGPRAGPRPGPAAGGPGAPAAAAPPVRRPAPGPAPRRPAGGQHLRHRAGRRRRAPVRRAGRGAARLRAAARGRRRRARWWSSCAPRTAAGSATRAGERIRFPPAA